MTDAVMAHGIMNRVVLTSPADIKASARFATERIPGSSRSGNPGYLPQLMHKIIFPADEGGIPIGESRRFYDQYLVHIHPQFLLVHVPDLPVDDKRPDDQDNGDRKLTDDKAFSQNDPLFGGAELPFQDQDRPKRG
jgi:hypothetical protein